MHKQCLAKVQLLDIPKHLNLIKLICYYIVDSETAKHRLLVYKFMPNKIMYGHLLN